MANAVFSLQDKFLRAIWAFEAGDRDHRESLKQEITHLRQLQENLAHRMREPTIGVAERETFYYSAWYWSAIHILVSIPKYQNINAIAMHLNLSPNIVEHCLKNLSNFGLVRQEKNRWIIASGSLHLPKNSPFNSTQHSNWRSKAVIASQNPQDDGIHYTVVQSLSHADYEKLKLLLLQAIDSFRKIANPSTEEVLVALTCDFFKV